MDVRLLLLGQTMKIFLEVEIVLAYRGGYIHHPVKFVRVTQLEGWVLSLWGDSLKGIWIFAH